MALQAVDASLEDIDSYASDCVVLMAQAFEKFYALTRHVIASKHFWRGLPVATPLNIFKPCGNKGQKMNNPSDLR